MQRAPPAIADAASKKRKSAAGTSKGVLLPYASVAKEALKPETTHTLAVLLSCCSLMACIESARLTANGSTQHAS